MAMHRIAVLPCDGVGPEVVREGLKVLDAACAKHGVRYEPVFYDIGGDRYLRTGDLVTDAELAELATFDAIYLGAVGHADVPPGVSPETPRSATPTSPPASWKRACCCACASSWTSTSTSAP